LSLYFLAIIFLSLLFFIFVPFFFFSPAIHPTHYDCVKLALTNNKHVLCEKPLMMNGKQTRELVELARLRKVYFQGL
jgi:hypothetical protein